MMIRRATERVPYLLPALGFRSAVSLLLAWSYGCDSAPKAEKDLLTPALESAVDLTIVPAMERFADGARDFEASVTELCDAPSKSRVVALQDEWLALSRTWNQAGIYFLGPLDDDIVAPSILFIEAMRQRGTDYTDTVIESIDGAVAGTEALDDDYFKRLAFNRVGMLALEVLLFEDTSTDPRSTDPERIGESLRSARKCRYLEGMTRLLRERAEGVERGWTKAFLDTGRPFRELLLEDMLPDGAEPVPAVLVAASAHLEYLRVRKLDAILDLTVATQARGDDSLFYRNLEAALDAVEELMKPPDAETGFFAVMEKGGFEAEVETVRDNLKAARAAVADRDRDGASSTFRTLEISLRREVPRGLGVDLGLSFSDGD